MDNFRDNAESAIIELETISPIHIRGKDIDYGEGMVALSRHNDKLAGNYAYLIDNDVLCDWLYHIAPESEKMEYIDAYVKYFERVRPDKQSLMRFLEDNKLIEKLEKIPEDTRWYKIFKGRTFQQKKNDFIQNGKGKCYIPGSSIKGCFKTAVLYSILKKERDHKPDIFKKRYKLICNSIEKIIDKKKKDQEMKHCADTLLEKIFSDIIPPKWEKHKLKKHNLDFFRCVHITDANIESEQNSESKLEKDFFDTQSDVWEIKSFMGNLSAVKGREQEQRKIHEDDIVKFKLSEGERLGELIFAKKGRHNRVVSCMKLKIIKNKVLKPKKIDNKKQIKPIQKNTVGWTTLGTSNSREIMPKPKSKSNTKMLTQTIQYFEGKVSFRIAIDVDLLNKMFPDGSNKPFKSINDLLDIMKEFASDLWKEEQCFFTHDISNANSTFISQINDFYKKTHNPTMRIGWGTGLLGMTVLLLFDKNNENGKTSIRKRVRNLTQNRNEQIAPKSRRFILDSKGIPLMPLGWCKLKKQTEIKMETGNGK
jgi:RAMP superfamily.